jgi:hypothetical protein
MLLADDRASASIAGLRWIGSAEQVKDRPEAVLVRLTQQLAGLEAQRGRSSRIVS